MSIVADTVKDVGSKDSQCSFDAFKWRNGQQRLRDSSPKPSNHSPRPGYMSSLILQHRLVGIECHEPCVASHHPPERLADADPQEKWQDARIPALREFPIISVVHPAYQGFPKAGHASLLLSGNLRLSCVRVLATGFVELTPVRASP